MLITIRRGTRALNFGPGEEGKGHNVKLNSGHTLLTQAIFPNFWFHDAAAYNICRMKGVPLGKMDFLMGAGPFDD